MGASSLEQQSSDKHVDQLGHIILGASSLEQQSTSRHVDQLGHIILGLAHWNNSPRVDMSINSATLSWFQATQDLLYLCQIGIQYIARTHVTMVLKRALSTYIMFYKATTEPLMLLCFLCREIVNGQYFIPKYKLHSTDRGL